MEPNEEAEVEETLDLPQVEEGEEDTTDWKAEAEKLREKAIKQREKTKTLKRELSDAKKATDVVIKAKVEQKTGGLDETQLDYLDLKGVSADEDVKIIERHVQRTGETVRQALKDDYVQSKLNANKQKRDNEAALPSSTKRAGGQAGNLASAMARFEADGTLPDDFELRSKILDGVVEKTARNKPSWHQ